MRRVMAQHAVTRTTRLRLLSPAKRVAVMLAIVAAATGCGGDGVTFEELSIEERNAEASPAVAYQSGADFVEALNRAGVECTNPTIYPTVVGGIHVADSFTCTYGEQDLVNVFVAWPSLFSSEYFSRYFQSSQEALADVSAQGWTLKGELWYARATDDQRLIDIQEALGGQLIDPGETIPSTTETIPSTTEAFPEVCQDAREAFHDWLAADHALSEAIGNVIARSLDLNIQVGQGLSDNLQLLMDQLNADIQTTLERSDESDQLSTAYQSLFASCLPLITNLPQACADEISQYPEVMTARVQRGQAQVTVLEASTALRDALIAGDQSAVDTAVDQVTAASDQLATSNDNWNNIVVPPFNAAVEACNAANS